MHNLHFLILQICCLIWDIVYLFHGRAGEPIKTTLVIPSIAIVWWTASRPGPDTQMASLTNITVYTLALKLA